MIRRDVYFLSKMALKRDSILNKYPEVIEAMLNHKCRRFNSGYNAVVSPNIDNACPTAYSRGFQTIGRDPNLGRTGFKFGSRTFLCPPPK